MNQYLENECAAIDASLMCDDVLEDADTRTKFKAYLERWVRAVDQHEHPGTKRPHPQQIDALVKERNGLAEEVKNLRQDVGSMRAELDLRRLHQDDDTWIWQGDGTDYPDSFGNSMCIVIRGEQLRDIVNNRSADKLHADVMRCCYPVDKRLNYKGRSWDTGRLDEVLKDFEDAKPRPA